MHNFEILTGPSFFFFFCICMCIFSPALLENAGVVLKLFSASTAAFLLRAAAGGASHTEHQEESTVAGRKSFSCDRTFEQPLSALVRFALSDEKCPASRCVSHFWTV